MSLIDTISNAFHHEDPGVRFECLSCGETFVVQRSEKKTCPACGSSDTEYLGEAE